MKTQKAYSNMPDHLLTETEKLCIHLLELFGIFVIVFGCIKAFLQYLRAGFTTEGREIKLELAKILAFALEFKLGGEILRTVITKNMNELYMLGAVILLRSFLTLVIHYEIKFESD